MENAYADVDEEEEEYGDRTDSPDDSEEHYSELGLSVPNWKRQKDPQWWIDYLNDLGIDPENP